MSGYVVSGDRDKKFEESQVESGIRDFDWSLRMGNTKHALELAPNILLHILSLIKSGQTDLPNFNKYLPRSQWEHDNWVAVLQYSEYFGEVMKILEQNDGRAYA